MGYANEKPVLTDIWIWMLLLLQLCFTRLDSPLNPTFVSLQELNHHRQQSITEVCQNLINVSLTGNLDDPWHATHEQRTALVIIGGKYEFTSWLLLSKSPRIRAAWKEVNFSFKLSHSNLAWICWEVLPSPSKHMLIRSIDWYEQRTVYISCLAALWNRTAHLWVEDVSMYRPRHACLQRMPIQPANHSIWSPECSPHCTAKTFPDWCTTEGVAVDYIICRMA